MVVVLAVVVVAVVVVVDFVAVVALVMVIVVVAGFGEVGPLMHVNMSIIKMVLATPIMAMNMISITSW